MGKVAGRGGGERRASPLDERARQLCLDRGRDPDERVAVPGKPRGMPLWCTYREEARAEQNEAEAAALAGTIAAGRAPPPAQSAPPPARGQ